MPNKRILKKWARDGGKGRSSIARNAKRYLRYIKLHGKRKFLNDWMAGKIP